MVLSLLVLFVMLTFFRDEELEDRNTETIETRTDGTST